MKKITLFALLAGAIISSGAASAQGVYLDFGNNPAPAIATTTDPVTGITMAHGTGPENGTAIAETAEATIGPTLHDLGRSTAARTAGPYKMGSASRTGAIDHADPQRTERSAG